MKRQQWKLKSGRASSTSVFFEHEVVYRILAPEETVLAGGSLGRVSHV